MCIGFRTHLIANYQFGGSMLKDILNEISSSDDYYYVTVIDHINKTKCKLTLDEVIDHYKGNLSSFDSIVMPEVVHDSLTSQKNFKPAKSTIVVTKQASPVPAGRIINYSDYSTLNCKFATPEVSTDTFLDKVEITLPLTCAEAKRLKRRLVSNEMKNPRIRMKKHNNAMAVKYKKSFTIRAKDLGNLMLLIAPVSGSINKLKLIYNPSNHSQMDLSIFIIILKKICGRNFKQRILNANITRLDFTFDGDGYFVDDVMFNLQSGQYFKLYISPDGIVETKISGANRSIRVQAYDKTVDLIKSSTSPTDSSKVKTRFEISLRPHNIKKIGKLQFLLLDELLPLFPNIHIYDANKLKQLLGDNSLDWEIAKYFGISALRRTKNNTERTKLSKLLDSCKLEIDESMFNTQIQTELKSLLGILLGPTQR